MKITERKAKSCPDCKESYEPWHYSAGTGCPICKAQKEREEAISRIKDKGTTYDDLVNLALDMQYHLEYTGWGDGWERECSEPLRAKVETLL